MLTRLQRQLLKNLRDYRTAGGPSVPRLFLRSWRSITWMLVRLILVLLLVGYLGDRLTLFIVFFVVVGIVVGTITTLAGTFWAQVKVWPVLAAIINWQSVDDLLDATE